MQSIYATALILYILDETTDDRRQSTTSSIYRDQAGYSTEDGTGRHETAHGTRQHEEPGHDSQWDWDRDRDIVASDFLSVLYTETISVQFQMSGCPLHVWLFQESSCYGTLYLSPPYLSPFYICK